MLGWSRARRLSGDGDDDRNFTSAAGESAPGGNPNTTRLTGAPAVGAQMFGFMGMLLSVPAAGLLKVAARAAAQAYRDSPFFRLNAPA